MTRYRIAFRAGRWAVQKEWEIKTEFTTTRQVPTKWETVARWRFRLLAKIHLVLLREWQREDEK